MKVGGAGVLHPLYEQRELDRMLEQMLPGSGDGRSLDQRREESPWNERLPKGRPSGDERMIIDPPDDMSDAYDPTISPRDLFLMQPSEKFTPEQEAMLMDPGRMAIANLLGGAAPQAGKFKMPELGKGMMSMGLGGPQAPVQREIMPLPVSDQALLPLLAEGAATGTGGINQGTAPTGTGGINQGTAPVQSNLQPMASSTGTVTGPQDIGTPRIDPVASQPTGDQSIGAPRVDPIFKPFNFSVGRREDEAMPPPEFYPLWGGMN